MTNFLHLGSCFITRFREQGVSRLPVLGSIQLG